MDVERRRKMLEEKVQNHTIDLKRETKAREGILLHSPISLIMIVNKYDLFDCSIMKISLIRSFIQDV